MALITLRSLRDRREASHTDVPLHTSLLVQNFTDQIKAVSSGCLLVNMDKIANSPDGKEGFPVPHFYLAPPGQCHHPPRFAQLLLSIKQARSQIRV